MRPKNLEKEQAIRTIALDIIANEGLENLSMQKLAKATGGRAYFVADSHGFDFAAVKRDLGR